MKSRTKQLIRGWDTLSAGSRKKPPKVVRSKGRLELAASEWHRLGKTREALWSERQLAELVLLDDSDVTVKERAFIVASRGAAQRSRFIRRALIIALCPPCLR